MSNISRRDFMKTAGVMTLAVAASGVLAGCSTSDAADNKVTEVTATSATVGDYTFSIKDTKLVSVKTYKNTGKLDTEERYIFVLCALKANKDNPDTVNFTVGKANFKNLGDQYTIGSGKKTVNDLFGLKSAVTVNALGNFSSIASGKKVTNATTEGTLFYAGFAVNSASLVDGTTAFYTPSGNIAVIDGENDDIIKLPVSIPAVTELTNGDYTFAKVTASVETQA